jgi:hypothetical protein
MLKHLDAGFTQSRVCSLRSFGAYAPNLRSRDSCHRLEAGLDPIAASDVSAVTSELRLLAYLASGIEIIGPR